MEQVLSKIEKICGKENMETFYTKFKENLAAVAKEGEKKDIKVEVKGGETEPKGFGLSITSVNKETYGSYLEEKDYMKDALTVLTVQIGLKDPSKSAEIETLFNQYKGMLDEFPLIKPYLESKKIEYFLRFSGNHACVDVVFKDEMAFKKLQEIGVDFSEYQTFKFLFKTNILANEIFDHEIKELAEKVCTLIFSFEATTTNAKFLITALMKTLDGMELKEEKQKKRKKKLCLGLNGVLAFMKANLNVQFDPKEFINTVFATKIAKETSEEAEGALALAKGTLEGFGGETAKGLLEGFGAYEPAKNAQIDELTISMLSTQYKNGFAFNLSIPGITQFLNEKFLSA